MRRTAETSRCASANLRHFAGWTSGSGGSCRFAEPRPLGGRRKEEHRLSYAATRDSEQRRVLKVAVQQFIQRYTSRTTTEGRRPLFLFPGGMGCQLLRARTPYRDNIATPQTF